MNRENYELLSASLLKDMAKKRGIRGLSAMRKSQVVDALVEYDRQKEAAAEKSGSGEEEAFSRTAGAENVTADRGRQSGFSLPHRSCGAHGGFRHAGESFPAFRRGEFRGK